jgi:hypothetical protein
MTILDSNLDAILLELAATSQMTIVCTPVAHFDCMVVLGWQALVYISEDDPKNTRKQEVVVGL